MTRSSVLLCMVVVTALAPARVRAGEALRIEVGIGETVEREVGFAMGLQCDDLTIIHADLRSSTPESNKLVVTGVTEGVTLCRAGTVANRPTYLFEIHVVPARHRR